VSTPIGLRVVAHRGASAAAPENTVAAFLEAARQHADAVELDVRRTRDGVLVVAHDATWARTTDAAQVLPGRAPWRVEDLTLAETRRLDAGSWAGPDFAGQRVPTLAEAFEVLRPTGLDVLVELKAPDRHTVPALVRELATTRLVPGRVTVQSFDAGAVRAFRHALPSVRVGVLFRGVSRSRVRAVAGWADLVNVHHAWLHRGLVEEAGAHGLACLAWTVNHAGAVRRLLDLGVDGVVTDRPAEIRAALAPATPSRAGAAPPA
jgi:glycerophosphoryl diester phosphodiesterase